jgi:hypothetical protein
MPTASRPPPLRQCRRKCGAYAKLFSNHFDARGIPPEFQHFWGICWTDAPISTTGGGPRRDVTAARKRSTRATADRVSRMQRQPPRAALQAPEQLPCEPLPDQLPPPLLPLSRPVPWALPGPPDTTTLTAPLFDTRPETLAPPPPETIPLEMYTLVRNDGSQAPRRVTTTTLHEPSNGPACAVETREIVQAAKAAAKVTARMDLLSIGDPRVGLMAPPPFRRRRVMVGVVSSAWARRS